MYVCTEYSSMYKDDLAGGKQGITWNLRPTGGPDRSKYVGLENGIMDMPMPTQAR